MAYLPVVALVGRPNVGKSTLFNRLSRSRAALVADFPGLTRDRQYARCEHSGRPYIVVDTGGFEPDARAGISAAMARQARQAVLEADAVLFIVDGREGLTARDHEIARELRRSSVDIRLVVNKSEGRPRDQVLAEFHELGFASPIAISAAHGDSVREMIDAVLERLRDPDAGSRPDSGPPGPGDTSSDDGAADGAGETIDADARRARIAVVGRPNVGKSTLINTLLGEERLIAFDEPGTTRDAIAVDFDRAGRRYTLVDTAGVRRRARVSEAIEKFSVIKTLQAIEEANVCVVLLDASEGVADQDASLVGYVLEAGRALVIGVNKWDRADTDARQRIRQEIERKLGFVGFARVHYLSALKGSGVGALLRSVDEAFGAAFKRMPTPKLTRALQEAVERQTPPRRGPIRPKLRYAHQGGQNPPVIVVHGSALDAIPASYRRFLEGWFRERFELQGTPLRVEFRSGANPYASR